MDSLVAMSGGSFGSSSNYWPDPGSYSITPSMDSFDGDHILGNGLTTLKRGELIQQLIDQTLERELPSS